MSTAADVVSRLGADCSTGLTEEEVERRRKAFGRNEFTIKEEEPPWRKYLNQVCCEMTGLHIRGIIDHAQFLNVDHNSYMSLPLL